LYARTKPALEFNVQFFPRSAPRPRGGKRDRLREFSAASLSIEE
jgi:hypothetical protein